MARLVPAVCSSWYKPILTADSTVSFSTVSWPRYLMARRYSYVVMSLTFTRFQMIVFPILTHILGDRGVLWFGIAANGLHFFVYGLARAVWAPFVAAACALFYALVTPGGRVQGFMSAARPGATILAPLTLTLLTAASLGENRPSNMKGLPFVICGSAMTVALFISIGLPPLPPTKQSPNLTEYIHAPRPPEDFIHVTQPPEDLLIVTLHKNSGR